MARDAGLYDRRVIVQKPTESVDAAGGLQQSWSQHVVRWMAREPQGGNESFVGEGEQARESARFRTHYTAGIAPKMRLLVPGKTTTLATGVSAATTAMKVADAGGFPLEGKYRVRIGSEVAEVTSGQGTTTWTVSRGVDGTSGASATMGTAVSHMEVYSIRNAHGDKGQRTETIITAEGVEPIG